MFQATGSVHTASVTIFYSLTISRWRFNIQHFSPLADTTHVARLQDQRECSQRKHLVLFKNCNKLLSEQAFGQLRKIKSLFKMLALKEWQWILTEPNFLILLMMTEFLKNITYYLKDYIQDTIKEVNSKVSVLWKKKRQMVLFILILAACQWSGKQD